MPCQPASHVPTDPMQPVRLMQILVSRRGIGSHPVEIAHNDQSNFLVSNGGLQGLSRSLQILLSYDHRPGLGGT